jgi:imidazolonepropionase-like amidohydrolase
VVIDGGVIGDASARPAHTVDGGGAVLLPGLIDAHVHMHDRETLEKLVRHGVTTALDMATWPLEKLTPLRQVPGLTDIRSAGLPAIGPGGMHAQMLDLPPEAIVTEPEQAGPFVAARVAEDVDYVKIVLEAPGGGGPELPATAALVEAAHQAGKQVVAHATSVGAYEMAMAAGADIITHSPIGAPLTAEHAKQFVADGRIAVPTLIMMQGVTNYLGHAEAFDGSVQSVTELYRAGAPVLAGSDAAVGSALPFQVNHGESLHLELELLVDAGLSTVDALRAATELPARYFGLPDRGRIAPGLRADLVLIDGDPLADIRATRNIVRVWAAGIEHKL